MSAETPATTTPPAPSAPAPVTTQPTESFDAAADRVFKSDAPAPAAAPTSAAAKRLLKLKLLDDKEEDFDIDDAYADETKRGALVADIQRGRSYDHAVERTQRETRAAATKGWNDWLASQGDGYTVVKDPAHSSGWRLVPRQATTPAAQTTTSADPELDALAKEEDSLKASSAEGNVDAVLRVAEIRAERKAIQRDRKREADAKAATDKAAAERSASERSTQAKTAYESAKTWLATEAGKVFEIRTKDFDGPNAAILKERVIAAAVAAGEAAARAGKKDAEVLEAAKAAVFKEADLRVADLAFARGNLPAPKPKYQGAPIVGTVPAGGGESNKYKDMSFDDAADEVLGLKRS